MLDKLYKFVIAAVFAGFLLTTVAYLLTGCDSDDRYDYVPSQTSIAPDIERDADADRDARKKSKKRD